MSKNDMLGPVTRALVGVPGEYLGTVLDVANKLKSQDVAAAARYAAALKKLNRGEDPGVPAFEYDRRKDGLKLLEDVPQTLTAAGFDPVSFLEDREDYIKGDAMAARAIELSANLGQHDAEWLEENQHLIPKEFRGKHYLVFPGTKWRHSDGDDRVPYLCWVGGRWYLHFRWLNDYFHSNAWLVRSRK